MKTEKQIKQEIEGLKKNIQQAKGAPALLCWTSQVEILLWVLEN